jgi:hypothetical protein
MIVKSDFWWSAVGEWEPLADLLDIIEREMKIAPAEAAALLRSALETNEIPTDVPDWVEPKGYHDAPEPRAGWVIQDGTAGRDVNQISPRGWPNVDWTRGSLNGHQIRVPWTRVKAYLTERLQVAVGAPSPDSSVSVGKGGRTPIYDWVAFNREAVRGAILHSFDSRADMSKYLRSWVAEAWSVQPDERTLQRKLADLYPADLPED